ncbi:MAG: HU family DNA-binding protein [Candidatus Anaerobiospirillum merdipullorum]|uniref:HU family DNA-binding protein n=1 Tax=Candidatus Anaerobiospirillum merdipullorum TaxID=2838450 RepID=A0A9E2KP58_9GAMM|nr:HU family DNA-binding protein [Candidatus Anaerobiospirillum merdipullorum]
MVKKGELVEKVAAKANLSTKEAAAAVNAFMDVVQEALGAGDSIALVGFGTFMVRERAERTGLNPRTKEKLVIPAVKVPAFKAGKSLKDAVNK